jgi:hypothetical protein
MRATFPRKFRQIVIINILSKKFLQHYARTHENKDLWIPVNRASPIGGTRNQFAFRQWLGVFTS